MTYLTPSLSKQGNHIDVGRGLPRDHAYQDALPNTTACHDPDSLAFTKRYQPINGSHACSQRILDLRPFQRARWIGSQWPAPSQADGTQPIDRLTKSVQYTTHKAFANLCVESSR